MTIVNVKSSDASISVVVPTFREVENIPLVVTGINKIRESSSADIELIFMDDDSRGGSAELVESLALPWVRMVTRTSNRGLSYAVMDRLRLSTGEVLVVMDADLSHPPERIPDLLAALEGGCDIAVGSRFAADGSTADD